MKAKKLTYRNLPLFCLMLLTTFMWGCNQDDDEIQLDLVSFNNVALSSHNEVPEFNSIGTGQFNGVYNRQTKKITYNVTWVLSDLDDNTVGMHFHGPASPNESAPVVIPVTGFSDNSGGTFSGTTRALTKDEEEQLLSGKWYFNIHSTTHPTGELRGNLLRKK
ncbi:CHRD domain-containing protein [Pontibacter liquoris]|uniref:CHRD domain-containing protein n=1 Tax=Pontibacter liquoris TaxID=2905677 RepID=UPI001FA771D2|nr:CHRD domain-containing protein [Pontibacter liquoris]